MDKKEMTAVEYLKARKRMADKGAVAPCAIREESFPEEAVSIVHKWAEENPVKTFLSDFLEKHPNASMDKKGFPDRVCPNDLGYVVEECPSTSPLNTYCLKCWSRPLEG